MNDEQRDACLIEIKVKVAHMMTDIVWLKRILIAAAILVAALLGIPLPDTFIHE